MKNTKNIYILYFCALLSLGSACGKNNKSTSSNDSYVDEVTIEYDEEVPENKIKETKKISHVAVDMGLPSGIKWASTNVGASSPFDIGDYFELGEIEPQDDDTRKKNKLMALPNNTPVTVGGNPQYDASTANWGEEWRMPNNYEFYELLTECAWMWMDDLENEGYRIIGPNGNVLFLPTTGYRDATKDEKILEKDGYGYYWEAPRGDVVWYNSLSGRDTKFPCFYFNFRTKETTDKSLGYGMNVRPITSSSNEDFGINESDIENSAIGKTFTLTKSGSISNHDYVDLGLPSGTKWATMNIGATNFFDYGSTFQWGAIDENFSFDSYYGETLGNDPVFKNIAGNPKYDAATAQWGESWRLPTKEEIAELANNCEWYICWKGNEQVLVGTGPNKNILVFPIYTGNREGRLCSIWSGTHSEYYQAYTFDLSYPSYKNNKPLPTYTPSKQNVRARIRPISNQRSVNDTTTN